MKLLTFISVGNFEALPHLLTKDGMLDVDTVQQMARGKRIIIHRVYQTSIKPITSIPLMLEIRCPFGVAYLKKAQWSGLRLLALCASRMARKLSPCTTVIDHWIISLMILREHARVRIPALLTGTVITLDIMHVELVRMNQRWSSAHISHNRKTLALKFEYFWGIQYHHKSGFGRVVGY